MIVTQQKPFKEILDAVDEDTVFIVGCSECATMCKTGGEDEVRAMKKNLENHGVMVSGWVVLDPACHRLNDQRILRKYQKELADAQVVLCLSCGNGIQVVADVVDDQRVVSGNETLFLGEIKHIGEFEERCVMCGECVVERFSGLCPVARCPKSMLNGPCSGCVDGKCEVDPSRDCVWALIYERLKKAGDLERLEKIQLPKDWSKAAGEGKVVQ